MTDPASVRKAFEEATKLGGLWGPVASTPSTKGCCSLMALKNRLEMLVLDVSSHVFIGNTLNG